MRAALALLALLGCATLPEPTPLDAERTGLPLARLAEGRRLTLNRCGSCHRPLMPAELSAARWTEELAEMGERAKLSDEDERLVLDYLLGMRDAPPPP